MTPTPRVSVIIPAYNAEAFIGDTLRSVLDQTYANLEVVVSDDGSTDGTREVVAGFGDRVKWISGPNSGRPSAARNAGARVARGSLLVFLDADDLVTRDRVEAQVHFLARYPQAGMVFSDYEEFGAHRTTDGGHFATCAALAAMLASSDRREGLVLDSRTATELLLSENFASSSPMVRRQVFDLAGRFDPETVFSEDFDFNYRAASVAGVGILPRTHWFKRQHPLNLSTDVARVLHWKIAVRGRILARETLARRRRTLRRRIATWHEDLAFFYTGRDNAAAMRHILRGLALSGTLRPALLARLGADMLGRSTNRSAS